MISGVGKTRTPKDQQSLTKLEPNGAIAPTIGAGALIFRVSAKFIHCGPGSGSLLPRRELTLRDLGMALA